MNSKQINNFFKNLKKKIKNPKTALKYKNKFTLLVSVVLSAQCTDKNVNNVTKEIYKKYFTPEHFLNLGKKRIQKLIKKIGLFRNKSKSIYNLSKELIEKHRSKIPGKFNDLIKAIRSSMPRSLRIELGSRPASSATVLLLIFEPLGTTLVVSNFILSIAS